MSAWFRFSGRTPSNRALRGFRLPPVNLGAQCVRVLLTAGAALGVMLLHGFDPPAAGLVPPWVILLGQLVLIIAYYADVVIRQGSGRQPIPEQRFDWIDTLILIALGTGVLGEAVGLVVTPATLAAPGPLPPWLIAELAMVWLFITEIWRLNIAISRRLRHPGILFPLSFLFLIAIGTLLIKMPLASTPGERLSWLDALFTMTSAVCVTGLVVKDTAHDFTPLGQTIIAIFIQLGAIGFILAGSMVALLLGQRITLRGTLDMSAMLQNQPVDRLKRFTRFILISIIMVELIGALAMYALWRDLPGEAPMTPTRRLGFSLFHTISAFCNAGFDITGQSMVPYRYSSLAHLVIAPLIIIGGIGFPVLFNLAAVVRCRIQTHLTNLNQSGFLPQRLQIPRLPLGPMPDLAERRLTLHTRLVLVTTIAVYIAGMGLIGLSQAALWGGGYLPTPEAAALTPAGIARTLADASFMSITARTAGFNTVPMEEIQPAGRFILMCLMFIGGSPGGSAGGIKTAVVAVLFASVISKLRDRNAVEVFRRSINDSIVRLAATVTVCYFALIVIAVLLLTLSEPVDLDIIIFEAISAATTTGLSLGLTPHLTPFGKVIIILVMIFGRIGPLALFAALVLRRRGDRPYAYPHESVALA